MAQLYKHTCDKCRSGKMEMHGTVIEDSFDAAMAPFRVYISPGKYKLWCDECIERFSFTCPRCLTDFSVDFFCCSEAFAKTLGCCLFCYSPLQKYSEVHLKKGVKLPTAMPSVIIPEVVVPVTVELPKVVLPSVNTNVQLMFRPPKSTT